MINEYEKQLVEIMIDESCSFVDAMGIVFDMNEIDRNSVFDLVDFLESKVDNLEIVSYYMDIWTGKENDMILRLGDENTQKE